ncbi:MAG: DUF6754 domain-containing protein [bacterium]
MEHATTGIAVLELSITAVILVSILLARGGKEFFLRRISAFSVIDEAIGRAVEMGRPILFSTGLSGFSVTFLQALAILSYVVRRAAEYGVRVIVPLFASEVYPLTEEVCKEAYRAAGKLEEFNPSDVFFLSNDQFAYASGVVGIMHRERTATHFFLGDFAAESLILAEEGHSVGAVQIAGTPSTLQLPFFVAACDYTLIGEEYYAASAYISREPVLLGSIKGQDMGKIILLLLSLSGVIGVTLGGKMAIFFQHIFK